MRAYRARPARVRVQCHPCPLRRLAAVRDVTTGCPSTGRSASACRTPWLCESPLRLLAATNGKLPENSVITLPKIQSKTDVETPGERLIAEERAELASALLELDDQPDRSSLAREELDRQLASSIPQARRGEFVDEASVLSELDRP